jgi:adenosylcobinamide-GDP ribazoletransferase
LVDGCAAGLKVQNHLPGNLGRIRRNAQGGHAVITGENRDTRPLDARWVAPLPTGEPKSDFLETSERAGWLRQLSFPVQRFLGAVQIRSRELRYDASHFRKVGDGLGWVQCLPPDTEQIVLDFVDRGLHAGRRRGKQSLGRTMDDQNVKEAHGGAWNPLAWVEDSRLALSFFTRLPVWAAPRPLASAARAFPIAGAVIGALGAMVYLVAIQLGLSTLLGALIAIAALACITGALHEDGLADFCDMLGARGDREAKLAVMRDSRIGTYGVLALGFFTAIKTAAIADLGTPDLVASALVCAHLTSRGSLPLAMRSLPLARSDGLAFAAGQPSAWGARLSLGIGLLLAALVVGPGAGLVAAIAALAGVFLVGEVARRQVGGLTGDALGCGQQLGELAVLVNLAALT